LQPLTNTLLDWLFILHGAGFCCLS
jgi:hypothetical protein